MARVFLNEYNKPFNPKGNQLWIFIGSTDAEAKTPILWPPDGKSQLIGKDPNAGKDWRQEEKGTTEDEMVGLNHQLNEFEQTPGDDEGQGILACCSPWGGKEPPCKKEPMALSLTASTSRGVSLANCISHYIKALPS